MIIYKFIVIVLFLVILQNTYIIFKINSGCCEFKDVGAIDIVMLTYSRVKFTDLPLSTVCVVRCTQRPRSNMGTEMIKYLCRVGECCVSVQMAIIREIMYLGDL